MPRRPTWAIQLALLVAFLVSFNAVADPPARVGRISEFGGTLYLASPDTGGDWTEIGLNYPITSGDNLFTVAGGRAEIEFGAGFLRLSGDTSVTVATLDDHRVEVHVASGQVAVRVRSLDSGDTISIRTPNAGINLLRAGEYRVDVAPSAQSTVVATRDGEAQLEFSGVRQSVAAGQQVRVTGIDAPTVIVASIYGYDAFDAWNQARDRSYESVTPVYVPPEMVGWNDLEGNGYWEQSPDYGAVWYPTAVAVGWVPYRHGRWSWVRPWGWNWIDDARWGYATSHYGRWIWSGSHWGWCPGARTRHPVYAPALVAFHGGVEPDRGNGEALVSWVPLGWNEAYYPLYTFSTGYWRRVNTPYVRNLAERPAPAAAFSNANAPGALTAVSQSHFGSGKPIANHAVSLPPSVLRTMPAIISPATLAARPATHGMIAKPADSVPPAAATLIRSGSASRTQPLPFNPASQAGATSRLEYPRTQSPVVPVAPPAYGMPSAPAYVQPYRGDAPGHVPAPRTTMPAALDREASVGAVSAGSPAPAQPAAAATPVHPAPAVEVKIRPN